MQNDVIGWDGTGCKLMLPINPESEPDVMLSDDTENEVGEEDALSIHPYVLLARLWTIQQRGRQRLRRGRYMKCSALPPPF
jgi:hypothetical protein